MNWKKQLASLLVAFGLAATAASGKEGVVSVLIVDGFGNHDWRHTTRCIQTLLEQSGKFAVSVSTYPAHGGPAGVETWNPLFENHDVVIQTCNDIGGGPRWPRRVEEALERYVEKGGGLFVFHSGNNAFVPWAAYNRMIGLGWRGKDFGWAVLIGPDGGEVRIPPGEGEKTSHGARVDALLTRVGDHPIHAGLPRQWMAADIEIYRYARGPAENLTVLSYARDQKTGLNFPIEWAVSYGAGRVYNSTFGHVWKDQPEPKGICCVAYQTLMTRAVEWLAGREVDSTVPADFPDATGARLRPYPDCLKQSK